MFSIILQINKGLTINCGVILSYHYKWPADGDIPTCGWTACALWDPNISEQLTRVSRLSEKGVEGGSHYAARQTKIHPHYITR